MPQAWNAPSRPAKDNFPKRGSVKYDASGELAYANCNNDAVAVTIVRYACPDFFLPGCNDSSGPARGAARREAASRLRTGLAEPAPPHRHACKALRRDHF